MSDIILTEVKNRVFYITLNRPDKRNAFNFEFLTAFKKALTEAENNEDAKVVVIRANGPAFSAGADLEYLKSLKTNSFKENLDDSRYLMETFYRIYTFPKIIIAQVQGHAIAGGCGLATICDFSFSAPGAKFGYPEVKIGFVPAIVMVFLVRKIGESAARSMLLSGSLIEAETAEQIGLINRVVNKSDLELFVSRFAENLCEGNSELSMSSTKKMLSKIHELSLEDALDYAAEENAKSRESEDFIHGISSFLEKEDPKW